MRMGTWRLEARGGDSSPAPLACGALGPGPRAVEHQVSGKSPSPFHRLPMLLTAEHERQTSTGLQRLQWSSYSMSVILLTLLGYCCFCCGYVPPLLGRCLVEFVPLSHSGLTRTIFTVWYLLSTCAGVSLGPRRSSSRGSLSRRELEEENRALRSLARQLSARQPEGTRAQPV